MLRFTIFNIPVTVQPWFWLILGLLGGGFSADTRQEIFRLILFVVAGFVSILIHELGHALTAKHYGQDRKIVLHGMGGLAIYTGGRHLSRRQDFAVIAGGPAVQLILGLLAVAILRTFPEMVLDGRYVLRMLAFISIILALVNLLPIYPLDGGQLLNAMLGPEKRRTTLTVSVATGAAVCIYCLLILGDPLFGAIAGYFAYKSFQELRQPSWR